MGKPQLDAIVDSIVRELRDGPCTSRMLQERLRIDERKVNRALQAAKPMIEYSKREGDKHKLWRMVERKPECKTHAQGFADGQDHAFQRVAYLIRLNAVFIPHRQSASIALRWADEIESGAWAEEED